MNSTQDPPVSYAGSCNPPRRVKRRRALSVDYTEPSAPDSSAGKPVARHARPRILPKAPIPGDAIEVGNSGDEDEDEDDYEESAASSAPKRRGRKPGTLSRSARESLRKLNHSRIEKARRTKINETLSTLSALVNEAERQRNNEAGSAPAMDSSGEAGAVKRSAKGKVEEKEFKLDVLVKTVAYMQELLDKVQRLESRRCPNCTVSLPPKVAVESAQSFTADGMEVDETIDHSTRDDEEFYCGDDEKGSAGADRDEGPSAPPTAPSPSSSSPRLPSISSWLPHPYIDPSCLSALSGPHPSPSAQLPSPPPSGRVGRASSLTNVPALALPGPAHPLPAPAPSPKATAPASPRRPTGASGSPAWTPEDESAASLLLQMSSSPSAVSPLSSAAALMASLALPKAVDTELRAGYRAGEAGKGKERAALAVQRVETPGSLLGPTKRI